MKTGDTPSGEGIRATTKGITDALAHGVDDAIHSSQQIAHQTFDHLADRVDSARLQATPVFDRLAHRAEALKYRGVTAIRDGSDRLRYQAVRATDSTMGYIRKKPVKSVLIAAAAGAVIVALVAALGRGKKPGD